jgi:hypothetical protein
LALGIPLVARAGDGPLGTRRRSGTALFAIQEALASQLSLHSAPIATGEAMHVDTVEFALIVDDLE